MFESVVVCVVCCLLCGARPLRFGVFVRGLLRVICWPVHVVLLRGLRCVLFVGVCL